PALTDFIATLQGTGGTAHLIGVISDGGVHGHISHVIAAARVITAAGVPVVIHAVTDGRDVAPSSAADFIARLQRVLPDGASIGTATGRYWAMDRDNRWDRVATAFEAMAHGNGLPAETASAAVA